MPRIEAKSESATDCNAGGKRTRVLIVAASLDILGGQAVQAARLLEGLQAEASLDVSFLPINPRLPGFLSKLQNIKYVRTVVTSLAYIALLLRRIRSFDVIHVYSASYFSFVIAPTPAMLIAKLYGKKAILNYHSGEAADHLARWRRTAIPLMRLADCIVVPSAYLVKVFADFGLQAQAIFNTVETNSFRFRERINPRPLFFANRNLEALYNVALVLRAFHLIQERFPEARLIIAGDGSERARLESLAAELNLRNVEFKGRVSPAQMPALYDAADIYLNGSDVDNMPLSILEAFAAGVPIVTTNAGGIPYIVENNETGLLVEQGDAEKMAACAIRLLEENGLAQRLTKAAHAECRKYSWDTVREEWLKLYHQSNARVKCFINRAKRIAEGCADRDARMKSFEKLRKLRGRSFDELCVRATQTLRTQAERYDLSKAARLPDDEELFKLFHVPRANNASASAADMLDYFRARTSPNFFASFADKQGTLHELNNRFSGEAKAKVIERANRICEGRFDLLGLPDVSFGDPVDWQLEPVSGKKAPPEHWSKIDYLNAAVAGDKKITWELNRLQHFQTLGRAYWHTGEEIYAQTFAAHSASWMNANPPKLGINWASSLEVSFRLISWLWALHFFKDSKHLSPASFARILKFLIVHARHLETYLSTYFSPNTHLTGEALGLYYAGALLPECVEAARWRAIGERILFAELDRHVLADGVYFEQASYYHRYTTDFYLHFLLLARANNFSQDARVGKKLTQLLDHLMFITKPDGATPFYGDDDGGRLAMLDERRVNDFRSTLATGAAVFYRADYKFVAGDATEETLWLLGAKGLKAFDELEAQMPARASVAFEASGHYVMRDGWTTDANYLLIDCGAHGSLSYGHAHADALGFELVARGRTLLVDPGTYTYTGSMEMRDHFRRSAAHNTLTIDGESSSVPGAGAFKWETAAQAKTNRWTSENRFDLFEGTHDGYMRLVQPATHLRKLLFLKNDYWIMRDRIEGAGAHRVDLHFHFAADAAPEVDADAVAKKTGDAIALRERPVDAAGLELFVFGEGGQWSAREDDWVSDAYGARAPSFVYRYSANIEGTQDFISFLVPRRAHENRVQVREIEAENGRAFEVRSIEASDSQARAVQAHGNQSSDNDSGRSKTAAYDEVLIGDGEMISTKQIRSDFHWTWARYLDGQSVPCEIVLIDGSHFAFADEEIINTAAHLNYYVGRRAGDEWHVETDADAKSIAALTMFGASRLIVNGETVKAELPTNKTRLEEYETV